MTESIFPAREVKYTTFWNRFVACFIDQFMVFMTWYVVGLMLGGSALAGLIDLVIAFLYNPLMEASPRQATLGKTGMRIKVTDMEGRRITYGQAFGRHFGKLLSAAIVFVGFFMMLWTNKKQTLHDRLAGTVVVSE